MGYKIQVSGMRVILLLLIPFSVMAGEATFTWTKPNPAWLPDPPGTAPAGWVIDEYRLYCTIVNAGQPDIIYNQTIIGYDTETATYTDIPAGEMSCFMRSWTSGNGTTSIESADSITVTKTIVDSVSPNPPALFDFVQAGIRQRMIASGQQLTSTTTYQIANQTYRVRCRISKSQGNQLISVCEDLN